MLCDRVTFPTKLPSFVVLTLIFHGFQVICYMVHGIMALASVKKTYCYEVMVRDIIEK
jgi:hypothetical protein